MRKLLLIIFSAGFLAIIVSSSTSTIFESRSSLVDNSFSVATSNNTDIKLNEIISNPDGDDDASMPGGEWVELYNSGPSQIDVNGWRLYDAIGSHELAITAANVSGESTIIPTHGFLVVYRNCDSDFSLNNDSSGDTVRLYNGLINAGNLIDSYNYTNPNASWVFARIPDGIGLWVASSTPTPGGPNV